MTKKMNIIETPCNLCNLDFFINSRLGLCNDCQDFTIKKVHKEKEKKIENMLIYNKINCMSKDSIPEGSCSKYRPDFVIDYDTFIVIVEVDEHQHKSYACECEISRMRQLHQDFGGIPIYSI